METIIVILSAIVVVMVSVMIIIHIDKNNR
jgi:hypothetical protein